jgi:photosystem II stability/assembly factor-like uncharacterized protein
MKKSLSIFLWLLLVQVSVSNAQQDALLKQQLIGKQNFTDIMNTVKTYYRNPETINRLGVNTVNRSVKKWLRYEWYMSRRLGPNGEFVNINQKMIEATGIGKRENTAGKNAGNTASISGGSWVPVGPMDTDNGIGRVDRLAFHPTDANIVYAGTTAGGLWRTTDAGANWTNLSPDLPSAGISGIVIDPVNTNTIYLLSGDGDSDFGGFVDDFGYMRLSTGVLKSTNGGANWTKTGDFPGADYSTLTGYRLIMHPSNNNILYACTSQGIWATSNGGTTWGLNIGGGRFFNMEFKPGSDNLCYATNSEPDFSRSYFLRSTNSGLIWDTVNSVTPQINNPTKRVELAVAASNPDRVYLLAGGVPGAAGNPGLNRFKGLLLSDNEGLSFNLQTNTPNILGRINTGIDTAEQSNYDLAVAVSNTNSNTLVTGGIQVWNSTNSGNNFSFRGNLHDDVHDLGYHPAGNKLWAATDGGVYSSTDHGANWTSHFQDMNITQFYRMAVDPNDYINLIAGAQDNAVKRKTGATTYFDEIACCDGFGVGYDNTNSDTIYTVNNQAIQRSFDGGNIFTNITPVQTTASWATSLAVHTSLPGALFVGSDSIWRSANAGTNWTPSINILAGWFLRTCPSNGNRVYAAGGTAYNSNTGILRRSDDGGVTWPNGNILSNHTGFPNNFPKITSINVDPTNSLRVWVTFGGFTNNMKVFYCDYNVNPAGNWVNRSGTLPNVPVNSIALDNANNGYIGTDNGVYYRGAGMTDWVPFYNNLPYVPVTDLIISEAENRIRATTFGRGIWSSELYSTCETDLNITGTLEGQEFHEASNNIVSTALLSTSEGTKVQMRAGNEVVLQPGFTARETTQFRAMIGPCGSGGVAGFQFTETDSTNLLPAGQYLPPTGGKRSMIHILSITNNEVQFEVNQKQNGVTDIILTDEAGKIIRTKNFTVSIKGNWKNVISIAGLRAGTYYLNVLLDKRVEHMQEVIIQ